MNFAQTLVSADRASLFLVDSKTNQMYARIFDIKDKNNLNSEEPNKDFTKEIRFPVGTGIGTSGFFLMIDVQGVYVKSSHRYYKAM